MTRSAAARREGEALRTIVQDLENLGARGVHERVLGVLQEVWGRDSLVCMYRPMAGPAGWALESFHARWDGRESRFADQLADYLRTAPFQYSAFDTLRPHPAQRNRVSMFRPGNTAGIHIREHLYPAAGLDKAWQVGALVCSGPMLLSYVGCFREEPLDRRAGRLLGRVLPFLRERLRVDRVLGPNAVSFEDFVETLDALPVPALITTARGVVEYANEPAAHVLAADGGKLRARIRTALKARVRSSAELTITPLTRTGAPTNYVVLMNGAPDASDASARYEIARRTWRLTTRELDVLSLVVSGDANKDIATKLRVAVITVEFHVSSILRKAAVGSRARLIAKFWTF